MTHITSSPLFGPVIRSLRMNAGLTQQQLGELSSVPSSMISTYERCVNIPEMETVVKLLRALGQGLAVLPAQAAKTQRQREDVVIAARARLGDGAGEGTYHALRAALDRLAAAEVQAGEVFDSPWETIRELHDELRDKDREIRRLRNVLADVHATTLRGIG